MDRCAWSVSVQLWGEADDASGNVYDVTDFLDVSAFAGPRSTSTDPYRLCRSIQVRANDASRGSKTDGFKAALQSSCGHSSRRVNATDRLPRQYAGKDATEEYEVGFAY